MNRMVLVGILCCCSCIVPILNAGEREISLREFFEKNKDIKFDPQDPMLDRLRGELKAAIRFEVREGSVDEISKFSLEKKEHFPFAREVLTEFQPTTGILPPSLRIQEYKSLLGLKRLEAERQVQIMKYILAMDLSAICPVIEFYDKKDRSPLLKDILKERINYLRTAARVGCAQNIDDQIAGAALLHLCITPDEAIKKVLIEHRDSLAIDIDLLVEGAKSLEPYFKDRFMLLDSYVKVNEIIIKDGWVGLVRKYIAGANIGIKGNDILALLKALFSESFFNRKEAKDLAKDLLSEMRTSFSENRQQEESKKRILAVVSMIVNSYPSCGDQTSNLEKEMASKFHCDESTWLQGEK